MTRFISMLLLAVITACAASGMLSTGSHAGEVPKFVDTQKETGIFPAGKLGSLAVWGDYNNDGWQDIILSGYTMGYGGRSKRSMAEDPAAVSKPGNHFLLFRSVNGKSFTESGSEAGLPVIMARAAAWADFNNDGELDLAVVTNQAGAPPILFENAGGGKFKDVSSRAGLKTDGMNPNRVNWADYDNDGLIDLFIAGSGGSRLYRNRGGGTFTDVTSKAGLAAESSSEGAVWFDFNNDGFLDLFLANTGPNIIYKNNGDGTFTDFTEKSGLSGEETWKTTSACSGDYNGDGFIDLYITNIGRATGNALYRNDGGSKFTDVTAETGTADVGDGRTCAFIDFDADGDLDIFTTNHIRPNRLFSNQGKGKFTDVASESGIDLPKDIFAATWADYDRDGFIDVYLNGHIGTALMKNGGNSNNAVALKLVGDGKKSNKSAIGARVKVSGPAGVQVREVSGGRGGSEQDMLPLYFGMGPDKSADIAVVWPGGKTCSFKGVAVGKAKEYTIGEKDCTIDPSG